MIRGLVAKCVRESLAPTLGLALALALIQALLAFALPRMQVHIQDQLSAMPFLRDLIGAMVGADLASGIGSEVFAAVPWVHPVVLAIVWAHVVALATRVPAGEIERGTIDVLMSAPVRRTTIFGVEAATALGASALVCAAGLAGNTIGASLGGNVLGVPWARQIPAAANLCAVAWCVGALALLASSLSDRRGRAIAIPLAAALGSFLLNYLAQFWEPARSIDGLGLLAYHRPFEAIRSGAWAWRDLGALLGLSGALVAGAGVVFARRDLASN